MVEKDQSCGMFQPDLSFAQSLDAADPLRSFRDRFLFPQHNGRNVLYFTGNSLGLQPKGVREALAQECDDWERYGVEGHFDAQHPWFSYHEDFAAPAARLVGALPHEVVMMNQLTVNLHLLLMSFYQPQGKRNKILFEHKPFPSDQYAFASQAQLHGLDPNDVLIELQPRKGEYCLREEDILKAIHDAGDELAVVCIGAVNYFTGQFFPLEKITAAAHAVGAKCGFDLAHTAGNLPLQLHNWNVDFACWCTYKYLNSGPGAVGGAYVHERHAKDKSLFRLSGWWGHNKSTRFLMGPDFDPIESAESWQMSNAPVFNMVAHRVALALHDEAGMEALRKKSLQLTAYLEYTLRTLHDEGVLPIAIITPTDPAARGCQLSVVLEGKTKQFVKDLAAHGVVADWREPNVIRLAPVPMYNSFEDVWQLGQILRTISK